MNGWHNSYSRLDRTVHKLVFSSPTFLRVLIDLEDSLFSSKFRDIRIEDPVFICGLPRSGTTTVLNILNETGCFATSTYRDMPMAVTPLLWDRLTGNFRRTSERRDRAHSDGIQIDENSAESFDEILWKHHWPHKYKSSSIDPWSGNEESAEFEAGYKNLIRKIILLRQADGRSNLRYLSKSNASIARLDYLKKLFPAPQIIVPFRNPVQHVASLHRQHVLFKKMQEQDPFALRYMDDIGHYDFGKGFKPISFSRTQPSASGVSLEYISDYWVAAYSHLLEIANGQFVFLNYDAACSSSDEFVGSLSTYLKLDAGCIGAISTKFKQPKAHEVVPEPGTRMSEIWSRLMDSPYNINKTN